MHSVVAASRMQTNNRAVIALIVCVIASGASLAGQTKRPAAGPDTWVALSADLRINIPNRPETWGRYVQDEHGCVRQDVVADGSALISLPTFKPSDVRLYGSWMSQPMRMGTLPRRPVQGPAGRKTEPIETEASSRTNGIRRGVTIGSPDDHSGAQLFRAIVNFPSGERRTPSTSASGRRRTSSSCRRQATAVTEQPGSAASCRSAPSSCGMDSPTSRR